MVKRILKQLQALLMMGCAVSAYAADLVDFVQMGLQNNLLLQSEQEKKIAEQAHANEEQSKWLPQIGLVASLSRFNFKADDSEIDHNSRAQGDIVSLLMEQKIIDFSSYQALIASNMQSVLADIVYQLQTEKTVKEIANLYFTTLTAYDALKSAKQFRTLTEQTLSIAEKNYQLKLITEDQVAIARAQTEFALSKVMEAKQAYQHSLSYLQQLSQSTVSHLSFLRHDVLLHLPKPHSKKYWVQLSQKANPQLRGAALNVKIAKAQFEQAWYHHFPTLSAYAGLAEGRNISGPGFLAMEVSRFVQASGNDLHYRGGSFGLEAKLPIFAGGAISLEAKRYAHLYKQALLRYQDLQQKIALDIDTHYDKVILSREKIAIARTRVQADKQALRIQKLKLHQGENTLLNYSDSENRLFKSESQYNQARHQYVKNYIDLYHQAGTLNLESIRVINHWLATDSK